MISQATCTKEDVNAKRYRETMLVTDTPYPYTLSLFNTTIMLCRNRTDRYIDRQIEAIGYKERKE